MSSFTIMKYMCKLNRESIGRRDSATVAGELMAPYFAISILSFLVYELAKILPVSLMAKINELIILSYSITLLLLVTMTIKKFYYVNFEAPEGILFLITPTKRKTVIITRMFFLLKGSFFMNLCMIIPIVLGGFFSGYVSKEVLILSLIQIGTTTICVSCFVQILFGIAFILTKGKNIKTISYLILLAVGAFKIIISALVNDFDQIIINQANAVEGIFDIILTYPKLLIQTYISWEQVNGFFVNSFIYTISIFLLSFLLMLYCYSKGFISLSMSEEDKRKHLNWLSNRINLKVRNAFIKKDLLIFIRSPKLLGQYISIILITLIYCSKDNIFENEGAAEVLLTSIPVIISYFTFNILQESDKKNQKYLKGILFNYRLIYESKRKLTILISNIIMIPLALLVCLISSVGVYRIMLVLIQVVAVIFFTTWVFVKHTIPRGVQGENTGLGEEVSYKTLICVGIYVCIPTICFFLVLYQII